MHLISVVRRAFDEDTGQFYGCSLELMPILDGDKANYALYVELWHRIRRDNFFKSLLKKTCVTFDASLYFRGQFATDCEPAEAVLMVNSASDSRGFALDYEMAEIVALKTLRRLDRLLVKLTKSRRYFGQLELIADQFALGDTKAASAELKELLKEFCHSQGFFINEEDVKRASDQTKARRRKEVEGRLGPRARKSRKAHA